MLWFCDDPRIEKLKKNFVKLWENLWQGVTSKIYLKIWKDVTMCCKIKKYFFLKATFLIFFGESVAFYARNKKLDWVKKKFPYMWKLLFFGTIWNLVVKML